MPKTRIGQAPARWIVDSLLDHLAEFRLVWCDTIRLELGTKRKWVARAQNVADDKTQSGRSNFFEFTADGWATILGSAARAGVEPHRLDRAPAFLSWYLGQVRAGKVMRVQSIEDLPPEAIEQIAYHRRVGIRSSLGLPLRVVSRCIKRLDAPRRRRRAVC